MKRNKFGNSWVKWNGRNYQSKAERDFHRDVLDIMHAAGAIDAIECQPKIVWNEVDSYRPDFLVKPDESDESTWYWVDVKGTETPEWRKQKKRWQAWGPGPLHVVKRSGKGWKTSIVCPRSSPAPKSRRSRGSSGTTDKP